MPRVRAGRGWWAVVLGLLLFLALVWLGAPVWFPWLLKPLARRAGLAYASYERAGYSHFTLGQAVYTNQTTRVSAAEVELPLPTTWAWRRWSGNANQNQIAVRHWRLEPLASPASSNVTPPSAAVNPTPADSTAGLVSEALAQLLKITDWFPSGTLAEGETQVAGITLEATQLLWRDRDLRGLIAIPAQNQTATITGQLRSAGADLRLTSKTARLDAEFRISTNRAGLSLSSLSQIWGNPVEIAARFGPHDVWPETATLKADRFRLPATALGWPGYADLAGSVMARWTNGELAVSVDATAAPLPGREPLPELAFRLQARGDTNEVFIPSAKLSAPGFSFELSRDVELHLRAPWLREPARLVVTADLAAQPWLPLTGHVRGEANFQPEGRRLPAVYFSLTGANVGATNLTSRSLTLQGSLHWPNLRLTEARAGFQDDSVLAATGSGNLKTRGFEGKARFQGPLLNRFLPKGSQYRGLAADLEFSGQPGALRHTGVVRVAEARLPGLRPLQAGARWRGTLTNLALENLEASAPGFELSAAGTVACAGRQLSGRLDRLAIRDLELTLARPAEFTAAWGVRPGEWRLQLDRLELNGPGRQLELGGQLIWPGVGAVRAAAQNLDLSRLSGLLARPLDPVLINNLSLGANWTNGPADYYLRAAAASLAPVPFSATADLRGSAEGLVLRELTLATPGATVARASGALPMLIRPQAGANLVQFLEDAKLSLTAEASPDTHLLSTLAPNLPFAVTAPKLKLEVNGTGRAPKGHLTLSATQIHLPPADLPAPVISDLRLALELSPAEARLTRGSALVQGQLLTLTGKLPMGPAVWNGLLHGAAPDWTTATARLHMHQARLAAAAEMFPTLLSPQGALEVDLTMLPGVDLQGEIAVTGARTRPLGAAGPIRDIDLRLEFKGAQMSIESVRAKIGEAQVQITGGVDLSGKELFRGKLPPFTLSLSGAQVPLERSPEAIIRADLNLNVLHTNGAPPIISGAVRPGNSYFLADLRSLIPGKVAAPEQRPPYFSVSDPLLADWRLAVKVEGDKFLNVRSPVFSGMISANLNLQGTLQDPLALGDLKMESGAVRFPFASLEVQQGRVTLTSGDPYHPQLAVQATSKQFGYEIRMDASGTVDAPVLQFSSTPPLSSEQIVLMVTAGEIPGGAHSLSAQQKAQTYAMFLGRDLLAKLGFGDDAESRLTVHSGEEFSEQGKPTYRVEYKLDKNWSLVGEYDRFGDFNAGVKWRVYSR